MRARWHSRKAKWSFNSTSKAFGILYIHVCLIVFCLAFAFDLHKAHIVSSSSTNVELYIQGLRATSRAFPLLVIYEYHLILNMINRVLYIGPYPDRPCHFMNHYFDVALSKRSLSTLIVFVASLGLAIESSRHTKLRWSKAYVLDLFPYHPYFLTQRPVCRLPP